MPPSHRLVDSSGVGIAPRWPWGRWPPGEPSSVSNDLGQGGSLLAIADRNHIGIPPIAASWLRGVCIDVDGHNILWMLFVAIKGQSAYRNAEGNGLSRNDDRLLYEVILLQAPNRHETVKLRSICGPGDHGEPVLTIMFPHED